jgi:xanthine dehydrogenase accessory factor
MSPETLQTLLAARQAGRPVVLATRLADGRQRVVEDGEDGPLAAAAGSALVEDASRIARDEAGDAWFLHVLAPPPRLLIVGAVHIAQRLTRLAATCGFAPRVIDPRPALARAERFPEAEVVVAWPEEVLPALAPDRRTALVALSHDPKLDDPALDAALRSPAFYVGALGSRRSHAARLARLRALGHDEAALARVRGPVGLPIGARGAEEIALSIAAEVVAVRRGADLARRPAQASA